MRVKTESFICELPLVLSGDDERVLSVRFDVARQAYNACLSESLRRLDLMRQSKDYQAACKLSKGKKGSPAAKARAATFRTVDERFGFREYDLHAWAADHIAHEWLGEHLDINTTQKIATRAFKAAQQYAFGKRGRPRFKSVNQLDSVEGKTNASGIRFKADHVEWLGLNLQASIDPDDPVIAHGLNSRVKYVRLVRRRLNGQPRYYAQLVCEGTPYQKEKNLLGQGVIGLDPGPRVFGIAGEDWGVQVDLTTPLKRSRQDIRCLQRHIDRQRRANNLDNYLPDGRMRPGRKTWRVSNRQHRAQAKLAETQRKAAAHRKSLHGQLVNILLSLGNDIRIEKNSYRSFQRNFGKSVGLAAPSGFVSLLECKAANAGAQAYPLPTTLRLSQVCHGCGGIEKKPLSLRMHQCECGVGPVQRDVYSAWLACSAVPDDESREAWRLDANQAAIAWLGAESRLPAASSPISVQAFAAWAHEAANGNRMIASLSAPANGTEWLAGEVHAMTDEARNDVGVSHICSCLDVASRRESERVGRVATRTPAC